MATAAEADHHDGSRSGNRRDKPKADKMVGYLSQRGKIPVRVNPPWVEIEVAGVLRVWIEVAVALVHGLVVTRRHNVRAESSVAVVAKAAVSACEQII